MKQGCSHIRKVLIIDDEEADRRAMEIVLKKIGCEDVVCTDSGENGIRIAKELKPELVIIDVVLRSVDGFDICKKIKKIENSPKVIMITGHLNAVNAQKARDSGADELFEKTPGFKNIGSAIIEVLKRK